MSDINLKRFVDIDIKKHVESVISGTRDTVILYTAEGTTSTEHLISSMTEANTQYPSSNFPHTNAYLKVFFDNGGVKVKVIEGAAHGSITGDMLKALANEYICVAYASASIGDAYSSLKTLAENMVADSSVYGINEKIILAGTNAYSDTDSVKNFAVKYSSIKGAEMTIAAYLSKINVYELNSIYDYAFTQEVITPEDITDADFGTVIVNNMNVDIKLANSTRNCGGNCKDGAEITNEYVRIILHQTLTDRLIGLLVQKLKNSDGVGRIYNVIIQELQRYLASGYLTRDKIWTDATYKVNYNDKEYTIIDKGTPLLNGYSVTVLPYSALTAEDRAAHMAPPIYVIIADQYGIRKVVINGEVI